MKIEKVHIIQPSKDSNAIGQRDKIKLWGNIASVCLTKPYDTDVRFFECLTEESKKHLN